MAGALFTATVIGVWLCFCALLWLASLVIIAIYEALQRRRVERMAEQALQQAKGDRPDGDTFPHTIVEGAHR